MTRTWGRSDQRKAQLAEAAAHRFHRHGFHRVSLADVASDVGLSAPAVYRHFRNKEDLLAAAIDDALDLVDEAAEDGADADWPEFVRILAAAAVTRPDFWTLLQREIRNLGPDRRAPLEQRFRRFLERVTAALARERAELAPTRARMLAAATLAVLASPTGYASPLPVREQRRLIEAAAQEVSRSRIHGDERDSRPLGMDESPARPGAGRGEELLAAALRLFAERGYDAVSLDEIAATVGMAGPSVYHWFTTKADLLVVAFTRAAEHLAGVRRGTTDLDGLVAGYVDLAVRERLVLAVYVNEAVTLPDQVRRRVRAEIDADVAAWCAALRAARPEVSAQAATVLVHAARATVHDLVRLGNWHADPAIATDLRMLVHAALATEPQE